MKKSKLKLWTRIAYDRLFVRFLVQWQVNVLLSDTTMTQRQVRNF